MYFIGTTLVMSTMRLYQL